jgi:hypothetical protein
MAHDRIGEDTLSLTHEFLSLMLGVRRPGVTETLHALRKQGLISYGRGLITVEDRKGMERKAGTAYGTPEAEYSPPDRVKRQVGWRIPSGSTRGSRRRSRFNSILLGSVSLTIFPSHRVLNKILERRNAVTITVHSMLVPIDL